MNYLSQSFHNPSCVSSETPQYGHVSAFNALAILSQSWRDPEKATWAIDALSCDSDVRSTMYGPVVEFMGTTQKSCAGRPPFFPFSRLAADFFSERLAPMTEAL